MSQTFLRSHRYRAPCPALPLRAGGARRTQPRARPDTGPAEEQDVALRLEFSAPSDQSAHHPIRTDHVGGRRRQTRDPAMQKVQLAAKTLLLLPFAAASSAVANEIATGLSDAGVLTEDNAAAADGKAAGTKAKGAMPMAKPQAKAVQQVADTGSDTIEGKLSTLLRKAKEKLFFQEPTPPIGSARLSYAKTLQLLNNRMVKRMTIMADGKLALVEVPIYMGGHDYDTQRYDASDFSALYAREFPEWRMEMLRYYVELPGDFWQESNLHRLIKQSLPQRTGDGFAKYDWVTQSCQYVMEVSVVPPGEGYQWAAAYSNQVLLVVSLVAFRSLIGGIEWLLEATGKLRGPKLSEKGKMMVEMSKSIATSYNVGDKGTAGTGVRFEDVQGIDHVKDDIKEILTMLLGSETYSGMGARVPRGVLLEGPPGTGKTFLARAMATEAGVPFFSANGAEFVQMFQGIAASRVRALFKDARENAPAIVFIDEVDAIGKARNPDGYRDAGTAEREQGLMQMLVEMDGFKPAERVLVVAATNRRDVLDPALLRPGRFDRTIHMGTPSPENRYRILAVHARGKQIPRQDDDALLREAARRAVGYSGAELANMLNEAAILQVRYAKPEIDMEILQEVMDKARIGLPSDSVPLTQAKRHLASVWAGRAVAAAQVAGPSHIESVSLRAVGAALGRLLYTGDSMWVHERGAIGDFAFCARLLVPLYAGRAAEEVLYGRRQATLATAPEIATAGRLARWLCLHSHINPAMWGYKTVLDEFSPVTQFLNTRAMEELVLRIQTHAYHRALVIAHERRAVIETVAEELLSNADATVPGSRLDELMQQPPAAVPDDVIAELPFQNLVPAEADPEVMVEEKALTRALGLVKGDLDPGMFFNHETLKRISEAFKDESDEWFNKHKERERFATDEDAPFPSQPDLRDKTVLA